MACCTNAKAMALVARTIKATKGRGTTELNVKIIGRDCPAICTREQGAFWVTLKFNVVE